MLTVTAQLVIAAFICTVVAGVGKCPVWVPLVLVCLVLQLLTFPK